MDLEIRFSLFLFAIVFDFMIQMYRAQMCLYIMYKISRDISYNYWIRPIKREPTRSKNPARSRNKLGARRSTFSRRSLGRGR